MQNTFHFSRRLTLLLVAIILFITVSDSFRADTGSSKRDTVRRVNSSLPTGSG